MSGSEGEFSFFMILIHNADERWLITTRGSNMRGDTMGCCISYFIGFENERTLEGILRFIGTQASALGFKIVRFKLEKDRKELYIDPHEGCETLVLRFRKLKDMVADKEHFYWQDGCCFREIEKAIKGRDHHDPSNWPMTPFLRENLWFCSDFVKTEYAPKSIHAKVCELLRLIAPFASLFVVRDEADFYETRSRENLLKNHGYLAGDRVNDL